LAATPVGFEILGETHLRNSTIKIYGVYVVTPSDKHHKNETRSHSRISPLGFGIPGQRLINPHLPSALAKSPSSTTLNASTTQKVLLKNIFAKRTGHCTSPPAGFSFTSELVWLTLRQNKNNKKFTRRWRRAENVD